MQHIWISRLGRALLCTILTVWLSACSTTGGALYSKGYKQDLNDNHVATAWADLTLRIMKRIHGTPTGDSRMLGYIGLTMYESIVPSERRYQSIAPQLQGDLILPKPDPKLSYSWNLSLNAAQAEILRLMLGTFQSESFIPKINALEGKLEKELTGSTDGGTIIRSQMFGKSIAQAIFAWSGKDHKEDISERFPQDFTPVQTGKGTWISPISELSQVPYASGPLTPYWGEHRTFIPSNAHLPIPEILPYSESPDSTYYTDFKAVYEQSQHLSPELINIAAWWSDDPAKYYSPPAHSYYLANLVVKQAKPNLIQSAQTYASVGMATADAFVDAWKVKFHYYSERPITYINQVIDPSWQQIWPEPPFPAFVSGHAIQAGAVTRVLSQLYGEQFNFTDDAYQGRDDDQLYDRTQGKTIDAEFYNRSFTSFSQLAEEIAISRLYGGIHSPQDNIEGLKMGRTIGDNISQLHWKK